MEKEIRGQGIIKLRRKTPSKKRRTAWKKMLLLPILITASIYWGQAVGAQEYPTRPITMLIGMSPGGSTDACARLIAEEASKILGQEIIPVNKTGGGGAVATGVLANSKGDGYTIMAGVSSPLTIAPHYGNVTYDPFKDIIPIIQYGYLYQAFNVLPDSPHNSLKDLIEFARKNPGKVSASAPGVGTASGLAVEYLNAKENVEMVVIPYKGGRPSFVAFLGGHVTTCALGQSAFLKYYKDGKVKLLASTADKRMSHIPNVPTLVELGYPDGIFTELYMIAAPKGTPRAVVEKLENTFSKVMKTEKYYNLAGVTYPIYVDNPLSTQKLIDELKKAYDRNAKIIRNTKSGK